MILYVIDIEFSIFVEEINLRFLYFELISFIVEFIIFLLYSINRINILNDIIYWLLFML